MDNEFRIGKRVIGNKHRPFVIPEIGINHEGDFEKAKRMVKDAHYAGAECVKFQCHIIEDEMIRNDVIPGNAKVSIWDIMKRCALTEDEDIALKVHRGAGHAVSEHPARAAANRLESMGVQAYKIIRVNVTTTL